MSSITGIILFVCAAICKAVADTLEHHYDTSIFKKYNPKFWNPLQSYIVVKFLPFTKYRPDAWHLANSLMIVLLVVYGFVYRPLFDYWFIELPIYGFLWCIPFNVCYNKLFKI